MILGIPRLGIYSKAIKRFFEKLGCEVVMPPKVSRDIIMRGVMNSPDMQCFPFKATLGQEIYNLEHGATDLVMFSSCGQCRFKHYHQLQEHTLKELGYKFTMHALRIDNFVPKLMEITGAPFEDVIKAMLPVPMEMEDIERRTYKNDGSLRIGIIGEVYTCWETDINFDIVSKLQKLGANVHMSITLSEFAKKAFHLDWFDKREEKSEAKKLLTEEVGGHGFHSICNTIHYGKLGFDGVIHLMPLSCLPECVVEVLVDYEADRYGLALYRFPIDESLFEIGMQTRLQTFVSMLKRKKKHEALSRH